MSDYYAPEHAEPAAVDPTAEEWEAPASGEGQFDYLDPLSENYAPERAAQELAALREQLEPVQEFVSQQQRAEALAAGEERAYDILEELGVTDEATQDVDVARGDEIIMEVGVRAALQHAGIPWETVVQAAESPDPADQNWAREMAVWLRNTGNALIEGREDIAHAALQQAVSERQQAEAYQGIGDYYRGGGTASAAVFGGALMNRGTNPTGQHPAAADRIGR